MIPTALEASIPGDDQHAPGEASCWQLQLQLHLPYQLPAAASTGKPTAVPLTTNSWSPKKMSTSSFSEPCSSSQRCHSRHRAAL